MLARGNVTVANQGDLMEIFNVTVFASSSIIGTQTLALDSEQSANLPLPGTQQEL